MFGVLEVILRYDPIPGQSFGVGQGQIAFIVSLGVLSVPRLGAREPGRFISLGGLGSSRHGVRHNLRIWARGRAAAGLSSEMYFIVVRLPLRRKPGDVRSRNCRFGRRAEGGDQALMGAGSWARHSINTQRAGRTDPDRQDSHRRAKRRFQVAARAGSTFPLAWHLNVHTFFDGLAQR